MAKPANAAAYRQAVFDLAEREQAKVIVEVGVYSGGLSRLLANLPTLEKLILVDPWYGPYVLGDKAHMDAVAADVADWAKSQPKIEILRMTSAEAAELVANDSVDLFETDGDHSLNGIMTDIAAWRPKVRIGGILCGDNYEAPTVAAGVDKLLPERALLANGRVWWARRLK